MNRIADSVRKMRLQIEDRIAQGLTTPERVEITSKALDVDLETFARFQELKSIAFLECLLTLDEANYVFRVLGHTPDQFNGRDAATKAVFTKLLMELLERKAVRA